MILNRERQKASLRLTAQADTKDRTSPPKSRGPHREPLHPCLIGESASAPDN
jgi:hypothetical protein